MSPHSQYRLGKGPELGVYGVGLVGLLFLCSQCNGIACGKRQEAPELFFYYSSFIFFKQIYEKWGSEERRQY